MDRVRMEETGVIRAIAVGLCAMTLLWHTPLAYAQSGEGQLRTTAEAAASTPTPANTATQPTEPAGQTPGEKRPGRSTYDRIWEFTNWYSNNSNPVVQKVSFIGRYHQEFSVTDGDDRHVDEWNVRRLRVGPRVTLFRTFTFNSEIELNPQEANPFYVRLTDFYVQWSQNARLAVTAGKQTIPFTMDGSTSTKELLAIDRSNLSNNIYFPQEFLTGVSVSGKVAPWVYRAGMYSAGRANREFGEFTGGTVSLGTIGYDFAKSLHVKEALLTGNYVYQEPDVRNTFTRPLEHIVSVNFKFDAGRWGVRTDVSAATGYLGQSDLKGVMAMPFVNMTDHLQMVGRYTFLTSQAENGIRFSAYEDRLVSGRGDRYNELYLGANYYFYGHRLKLQSGLQIADMNDRANDGGAYSGMSWITGLRVGW